MRSGSRASPRKRPPPRRPALVGRTRSRCRSKPGSLRFAVIGDSGRGSTEQYQLAQQMVIQRERFSFDFVLMLGDNIYDSWTPEDYAAKFERPYKALLDDGVTFYAARGNHDGREQWLYPGFNTGGQPILHVYENRRAPETARWEKCPVFCNRYGGSGRGTAPMAPRAAGKVERPTGRSLFSTIPCIRPAVTGCRRSCGRRTLESIFVEGGVDVALSGHEHLYERFLPQQGVHYFTSGAAGSVRVGDLKPTSRTAAGFDADLTFMLVEISGDTMYFQAISRLGAIVDSGSFERRERRVGGSYGPAAKAGSKGPGLQLSLPLRFTCRAAVDFGHAALERGHPTVHVGEARVFEDRANPRRAQLPQPIGQQRGGPLPKCGHPEMCPRHRETSSC